MTEVRGEQQQAVLIPKPSLASWGQLHAAAARFAAAANATSSPRTLLRLVGRLPLLLVVLLALFCLLFIFL